MKNVIAAMLLMGTVIAFGQAPQKIDLADTSTFLRLARDIEVVGIYTVAKYADSSKITKVNLPIVSTKRSKVVTIGDTLRVSFFLRGPGQAYAPNTGPTYNLTLTYIDRKEGVDPIYMDVMGERYIVDNRLWPTVGPSGARVMFGGLPDFNSRNRKGDINGIYSVSIYFRLSVPINTGAQMADLLTKNLLTSVSVKDTAGTQVFAKQWPTEAQRDTTYALEKPLGAALKATWIFRMIGEEKIQFFFTDYGDSGHNRFTVTVAGEEYTIVRIDEQRMYGFVLRKDPAGQDYYQAIEISYIPKE